MDKEVFADTSVVAFFNKHFISVRLQMDKTLNDASDVRKWYSTGDLFKKKYGIPSFPTLLFFSPDGELIYRESGLKYPQQLIYLGKKAMEPGHKAVYQQYYLMLARYMQGKKDYSTMAPLADTSKILGLNDIAADIANEYRVYLIRQTDKEWLTRQNISFMSNFLQGSKDPFFQMFYNRPKEVDSITQKKGFAAFIVDKIIEREELVFITNASKGRSLSSDEISKAKEPDWSELRKKISLQYNVEYADRNVLYAQVQWYMDHHEWQQCGKYLAKLIAQYKGSYYDRTMEVFFNTACWTVIFQRSVDKDQIDAAIDCLKDLVERQKKREMVLPAVLDTYANLLYKGGRVEEAIVIEEEAMKKDNKYLRAINRMKQGKATWPHYISSDFFDDGLID